MLVEFPYPNKGIRWACCIAKENSFQKVFDEEWAKLNDIKDDQNRFVHRRYLLGTFLPLLKKIHAFNNPQEPFDADRTFFNTIVANPDPALFIEYVENMSYTDAIRLTDNFINILSAKRAIRQLTTQDKRYRECIINCLKRVKDTLVQEQKNNNLRRLI